MRRATLWNIWVCSYFWGARTFWGVRFRALVQSQKPSRRTDAHRSCSTRARLSEATTELHSLGRGSGGSPLSIKPIIMASDNTEEFLYTDKTICWPSGNPCVRAPFPT